MILRIQHKEIMIELDMRERIILHLAQDLPLPKTRFDAEALPRTIAYMARAFKVQKSTVNQHVLAMLSEDLLHVHSVPLQTRGRGAYSYVYVLTPEGQLLAEAIKRRAV